MAGQHGQQYRAQQVALLRGIIAGQRQWAVRHKGVKQSRLLEIVDEERQLPEWRDRRGRVPFDVNSAREGVRYR